MSKSLTQFRAAIGYPQEDNNASERFALGGGLSIEQVAAIGDPAKLLFCKNYEPNYAGGYRSKGGCEPVDGHRQPSAFVYILYPVTITNPANVPGSIGANVHMADGLRDVGPFFLGWETIGGQKYIVLTHTIRSLITSSYDHNLVSGRDYREKFLDVVMFPVGTTLWTGPASIAQNFGTVTGPAAFFGDVSRAALYIRLARKVARDLIQGIGNFQGIGRALGGFDLNGRVFGIRGLINPVADAGLFVAKGPGDGTGSPLIGWNQLALGSIVYFVNNNNPALVEGATVTIGATSMIAKRINTQFGTVGGGDACGYFSTGPAGITGGAVGNGVAIQVGGVTVATTPAAGPVVRANRLPAGGNYRFRRWNFGGNAYDTRMYGISGLDTAFEIWLPANAVWSTAVFTPLITGQGLDVATFNNAPVLDTPNIIAIAHDQLFVGYPGGNLSYSGYQTPADWQFVEGANQRYLGEDITNIIENINNTVLITTRNRTRMLYGDVTEQYQLRDLNTEAGAYAFTAVPIGGVALLSDEGVNFYDQQTEFGNFGGISLSQDINTLLKSYMSTGDGPLEATQQRDHSLYRLYFDGGTFFSFCIVGKELKGIGKCDMDLGSNIVILETTAGTDYSGSLHTNFDSTASFVVRNHVVRPVGAQSLSIHTVNQTIDPAKWPVGSNVYADNVVVGTVQSAAVNSARNFWSAASTVTNGNYNLAPGEKIYFCGDDGYLYEDDVGGSFGCLGTPIAFSLQNQFYCGQQNIDKMKYYRRGDFDVIGADAFTNLSIAAEYDDGYGYRSPEKPEVVTRAMTLSFFDQMALYGTGFYGGAGKNVIRKMLHGQGVGISILAFGESDIAFPHTLQAVKLNYATRTRQGWR